MHRKYTKKSLNLFKFKSNICIYNIHLIYRYNNGYNRYIIRQKQKKTYNLLVIDKDQLLKILELLWNSVTYILQYQAKPLYITLNTKQSVLSKNNTNL